jgi:heterodisulfide reductase subunit C
VLTAIKNLAAKAGYAPPSAEAAGDFLASYGRLLEVTDFENEKRAKLGLPPVCQKPEDFQSILGKKPQAGAADGEKE